MLHAGKLRHRITIQKPFETQNFNTGAVSIEWVDFATVWSAIEPISAREFIASESEVSKVTARITIRYRAGIDAKMRVKHLKSGEYDYYNIEGVLSDKQSGIEYLTLPCSEGVRYEEGDVPEYISRNLTLPNITGNPSTFQQVVGSVGTWTNSPTSYLYQWYIDDKPVKGASGTLVGSETSVLTLPNKIGSSVTFVVSAININGSSEAVFSEAVTIIYGLIGFEGGDGCIALESGDGCIALEDED